MLGLFSRGPSLRVIRVGSRANFEDMNRAVAVHRLEPVVDRVSDFDAAVEALRFLASGEHLGKIVIRIARPGEI